MGIKQYIYYSIIDTFSKLLPYHITKRISILYRSIISRWISHNFAKCKDQVLFMGIDLLEGSKYIEIGENTSFGKGLYLTAWDVDPHKPSIKIGKNCSFGAYNHISATKSIEIADGVLTGKFVSIIDNSHGDTKYEALCIPPMRRPSFSKGPIIIEKNVWIGDKVTILSNVTIGESAVIAANSVVTKDVPSFSVVAGNPAHIIKQYNKHGNS